jgi:hydroxymethylglutaryl-CoA lyase
MAEVKEPRNVKLIECPRDAMQGWARPIPTGMKIRYLNALLKVGFDSLDFGSFVSPGAIPQMADTAEVLGKLDWEGSPSTLLAIVANERGAREAAGWEGVAFLGYPFSISETFQLRNTGKNIADSLEVVRRIQQLSVTHGKRMVIYISMGFGNPYGDPYSPDIVLEWVEKLVAEGIGIVSLADTVGLAHPQDISRLFSTVIPVYASVEFGAHFHSNPGGWEAKVAAAYDHGCRRFDSAIAGIGGCPMAEDVLVGNIATENILAFLKQKGLQPAWDMDAFRQARQLATEVFLP